MRTDFENWNPVSIKELIKIMSHANFTWILAGGHALDQYVGYESREHGDLDILIDIKYLSDALSYFNNFNIFLARNGKLKKYNMNQVFVNDSLWISKNAKSPFILQILFFESANDNWIYKRNKSIKLNKDKIYFISDDIKILNPEIQLLYKMASHLVRKKDIDDYNLVYPQLSSNQQDWLNRCLNIN
ncbi:nucleotidyltransferase domain-containing protein [Macrococcoides caseolyticum]|uniref:nucleotidyltransferase domain-containing protein n=1 Tax=Macrococcoides caseolyticum TaxID=69966 RepID=UPI001F209AF1|nr:hypothetical protein [Macrococcus caseolyticus]MCE4956286.1 hypothetical protein [Macrococcus caseolyticus]